jgi:hypothetical protein
MRNTIAIPLLGLAVIIQSTLAGHFSLLSGQVDVVIVLLVAWALQEGVTTAFHWAFLASVMVGLISKMPWFVYAGGYFGIVLLAQLLQRRVWQLPMLAMFSVTFFGTVLMHVLSYGFLDLTGAPISFADALGLVTLPSVLLNMLIAIPCFGIMRDLAHLVYPSAEAA